MGKNLDINMSLHIFAIVFNPIITKMKHRNPEIFYFDDIVAHYNLAQGSGFLYAGKPESEPEGLKHHRMAVLQALWKNKESLLEVEEKMLNYYQEMIIHDPQVYVARTKDTKTEIEYFTAKTAWPTQAGRTKEIKIYLGKASDFGNDTQNTKAKQLAVKKMKETLRRRKDMGEI